MISKNKYKNGEKEISRDLFRGWVVQIKDPMSFDRIKLRSAAQAIVITLSLLNDNEQNGLRISSI